MTKKEEKTLTENCHERSLSVMHDLVCLYKN